MKNKNCNMCKAAHKIVFIGIVVFFVCWSTKIAAKCTNKITQ